MLLYLIALWAIFTGIAEIADGIQLRKVISNEWMLILGGVLSVIFGVLLLLWARPPGCSASSGWSGSSRCCTGSR
ncbi:DUF308 domain-containing protein [Nonomuraea ferruginea]